MYSVSLKFDFSRLYTLYFSKLLDILRNKGRIQFAKECNCSENFYYIFGELCFTYFG